MPRAYLSGEEGRGADAGCGEDAESGGRGAVNGKLRKEIRRKRMIGGA